MCNHFLRHSLPGVFDKQLYVLLPPPAIAYPDAAPARKLYRVIDQIIHHLLQPYRVRGNRHILCGQIRNQFYTGLHVQTLHAGNVGKHLVQ